MVIGNVLIVEPFGILRTSSVKIAVQNDMNQGNNDPPKYLERGTGGMRKYSKRVLSIILTVLSVFVVLSAYGAEDTWDCPKCGRTGNTGNFCGNCAEPRPEPKENRQGSDSIPFRNETISDTVINKDAIEIIDLIRLLKFLSGGDKEAIAMETYDLNGDGQIDLVDIIRMQKVLMAGG